MAFFVEKGKIPDFDFIVNIATGTINDGFKSKGIAELTEEQADEVRKVFWSVYNTYPFETVKNYASHADSLITSDYFGDIRLVKDDILWARLIEKEGFVSKYDVELRNSGMDVLVKRTILEDVLAIKNIRFILTLLAKEPEIYGCSIVVDTFDDRKIPYAMREGEDEYISEIFLEKLKEIEHLKNQ